MSGEMTVVQLTDCHLSAAPGDPIKGVDPDAGLAAALDHALTHADPDLLLLTGDLSNDGSPASYRRIRAVLAGCGIPALALPGNHDDLATMRAELAGPGIEILGEHRLGGWHLVLLDSTVPGQVAGRLRSAELARLAAALDREPDRPTLVALHHQPVAIDSPWMDALGLENPEALLTSLDARGNVRALVFGHIHQAFASALGGISLLGSPATSVQFRPGTATMEVDPRPPGYSCLTLKPDGAVALQAAHAHAEAPLRAP